MNLSDMEPKKVALDMWGEKSCESHDESMILNKFCKPFRIALLKIILDTLNTAKIEIMVYGGTALAAWRDNGKVIPHDHDIDLAILEENFFDVYKILNTINEIYTGEVVCPWTKKKWLNDDETEQIIYDQVGAKRIKVYFKESYLENQAKFDPEFKKLLCNYDKTNLVIDIFALQRKHGTNDFRITWNLENIYDHDKKCFPIDTILPLKEYMFEGLVVKGPRDICNYLKIEYGYLGKDCRYDPKSELYVKLTESELNSLPESIINFMTS